MSIPQITENDARDYVVLPYAHIVNPSEVESFRTEFYDKLRLVDSGFRLARRNSEGKEVLWGAHIHLEQIRITGITNVPQVTPMSGHGYQVYRINYYPFDADELLQVFGQKSDAELINEGIKLSESQSLEGLLGKNALLIKTKSKF